MASRCATLTCSSCTWLVHWQLFVTHVTCVAADAGAVDGSAGDGITDGVVNDTANPAESAVVAVVVDAATLAEPAVVAVVDDVATLAEPAVVAVVKDAAALAEPAVVVVVDDGAAFGGGGGPGWIGAPGALTGGGGGGSSSNVPAEKAALIALVGAGC